MSDETAGEGLKDRITTMGEDALGKLAQELLENPLVNSAIGRAMDARERAAQAQQVAMGALNIPSAADIERLTRRVRSVSQRLEGIEDGVDRLDRRVGELARAGDITDRLAAIEQQLALLAREVAEIHETVAGTAETVARGQESLKVGER
jgi:predicted  nucleic acid-binding Zn-ribbon protein